MAQTRRRRTGSVAGRLNMPGPLSEYQRKRDFAASPEPRAARTGRASRAGRAHFVVHLHHARSRHFDLRLQVGDVLRSWAVPKGPSLDPRKRRLAVEVEDHPLDYRDFEGVIPAGHYGAGEVRIWDRGYFRPEGDARQALRAGHLRFTLHGQRLHGAWSLVRTRLKGRQPQWLLIKVHDEAERPGDEADDTPLSAWRPRAPKRPRGARPARAPAARTRGRASA
ncbi:MAG TPA: DNA polymerase ligase N-terminal domain-containing protein [Steroidobacteraceae bacterium]|jgi:bifunctional non-homologous end joining protein LigD|nr:DNA polymerase ligase N-terminal domain-containing protein [Steroidobacteraceae bacterium]